MDILHTTDMTAAAALFLRGQIGVLRTDTLYGILAAANNQASVERVYRLKHRDEAKSPIVLIADQSYTYDDIPKNFARYLESGWPEKTSVILPSVRAPHWIRRANESVAYRVPADPNLLALLRQTGPLIAPSANPEGAPPARSVQEAKVYFGSAVDFYIDGGKVTDDAPSRLLRFNEQGNYEQLR